MQDYYVSLKFNQGDKSVKALYRLCVACCMLHNCKNSGTRRAHQYPKIMLSFMLVLQHWRETDYCGYRMMLHNMGIYNEELGELTFAILARSVLGDHTRDDFDHMDRLFKLLPVYRDVKSDVVADNRASNSLNWRHKIKKDGEEVKTTELFFKQAIRQMVNNTFTSYDGSAKGYSDALNGAQHRVKPINPAVYMRKVDLQAYIDRTFDLIKDDMKTNFLYPYKHIWPECIDADVEQKGEPAQIAELEVEYEEKQEELKVDDDDGGMPLDDEDEEVEDNSESSKEDDEGDDNEEENVDNDQGAHNPYDNRSWKAWGRVNPENTMIGKRQRQAVQRFQYNQRRRQGAQFPAAPSM